LAISIGTAVGLCACASGKTPADRLRERALALSVSDLQMHLSGDTYQSFAHLDDQGRNAFEVALWRLEQLRPQAHSAPGSAPTAGRDVPLSPIGAMGGDWRRGLASPARASDALELRFAEPAAPLEPRGPASWTDEDLVIEFARARALGRLRRYREAASAFARVEASRRLLAASASEHRGMMDIFASLAEATSEDSPESVADPHRIRAWVHAWTQLSLALGSSEYASLARLEAEVFDQAQVEFYVARGELESAIDVCHDLLAAHRASKLYPRHLIRLGDLYAELARREHRRTRTSRESLDVSRYERFLERAFAAYELATEARRPTMRREARGKIESLLAFHEGVRSDVH